MKYTLNPKNRRPKYASYRLEELLSMTTLQLLDICRQENIIHAALNKLDREELIHLVMTFRGARERFLLKPNIPEGEERLQKVISKIRIFPKDYAKLNPPSKISVFNDMETGFFDDYRINYEPELEGTNAFVLDKDNQICAILRVVSYPGHEDLFITRLKEFKPKEARVHDYRLLLCPHKFSDELTSVYEGDSQPGSEAQAYIIPLLSFEVCEAKEAQMPLAIDFGTSNTSAGIYLSKTAYSSIERNIKPGRLSADSINYLQFLAPDGQVFPVLPTVIGVERIEGDKVTWSYGFAADEMMNRGYMGQGMCAFYDIKRWAANFEETETLIDGEGNQLKMQRKEIIKAYLSYIISSAEQMFKCRFKKLFLSYPVKQRDRFITLYREMFGQYDLMETEMFDEGIAVLYSIIGDCIDSKQYVENADIHTLILDCGGGTTDQTSAVFRVTTGSSAYTIDIMSAYENGDTDFGGNNLTYRIMQLLKIEAAKQLAPNSAIKGLAEIAAGFSFDQYRTVDETGTVEIYRELNDMYEQAESIIPTRYRDYEYSGRDEYYKVYNNYYYLFSLAESVKKAFFANAQVLRIVVSSENLAPQPDTLYIKARRWKLAANTKNGLMLQKGMPDVSINTHQVCAVFQADIYDIFRRFIGRLYNENQLGKYKIVKLTGQSCKIGLFRDSLKEYVPGAKISQGRGILAESYMLKLACLDGAIRYLRDKTLGLAKVNIKYESPALPYILTAKAHSGETVTLIHPLNPNRVSGSVARHLSASEVEFTLSDASGNEKHKFVVTSNHETFSKVTYDRIEEIYGKHIIQDETDQIENGEIRYFVWADPGEWGFTTVPILRNDEELSMGQSQLRSFEDESWMINYFDGLH